jgi:transposase-like protein
MKAASCSQIHTNGKLNGVKRYASKGCKKYFSETTGKLWYDIKKKDALSTDLYCLLFDYSIRKCAKHTGISIRTSFDWSHKLLTSFSAVSTK